MVVSTCQHTETKKHGKDRKGNPRVRCILCGKTLTQHGARPLGDLRINVKQAATVLNLLLEGMSIRSTSRVTGICKKTICDLIVVVGENCERLFNATIKGIEAKDIQVDEIWSFVGCKERTRKDQVYTGDEGDSWTWTAIDRESKLMLAYHVGQRDNSSCVPFLSKIKAATTGRFQLSSDGLGTYTLNVPFMFRERVDFAQLIKSYGPTKSTGRYSPPRIIGAEKKAVYGEPDPEKVCTSHVERLNLTIRMAMRRFTRLTNAHSKSLKHHAAMQAIFFCFYNFCRKHETIRKTPAMAAGLADKVWTVRGLIEQAAAI